MFEPEEPEVDSRKGFVEAKPEVVDSSGLEGSVFVGGGGGILTVSTPASGSFVPEVRVLTVNVRSQGVVARLV